MWRRHPARKTWCFVFCPRHYQGAGENEKAILRYEQAAGSPKFAAEAKVLHAQLLVQQDRFADALPLLRQAQEIKRRDDAANLIAYVQRPVSAGRYGARVCVAVTWRPRGRGGVRPVSSRGSAICVGRSANSVCVSIAENCGRCACCKEIGDGLAMVR